MIHNYIGISTTSVHNRMLSHLQTQDSCNLKGPLARHDKHHHGGEKQQYKTKILHSHRKVLSLNLLEGLVIEKMDPQLNERNECGRGGLVRLMATRVT